MPKVRFRYLKCSSGCSVVRTATGRCFSEMADLFSKYRLSEALMLVYKLFWDEFSSYLLEIVKPAYGQPINGFIYSMVINCFERLLELLHPFMPFITEELWQQLRQREPGCELNGYPTE